mgnify:CR=1 FL=1
MKNKLLRADNNFGGVLSATISAAEVTSASLTPVPTEAPGIIVLKAGEAQEEHIYYAEKDAGAGTISGLIRDYSNLNGGVGFEHINTTPFEVMQATEYINNIVDSLVEGFIDEQQTLAYVSAASFTVKTNKTAVYTAGRIVRFSQDNTLIDTVLSSSYSAGTGLTTVTMSGNVTVPNPIVTVETAIQPKSATALYLSQVNVTSSVNGVVGKRAATGNNPEIYPTGSDTNIGLDIKTKGTGRFRKPTILGFQLLDSGSNTAVGDGKMFFRIPEELNGMNLIGVAATVYTAGTTNTTDIQIRNKTDSVDMLSTKMTIDSGETDTSTAATPAVIDTTKDDVVTGDVLAVDIDAISTTAAKGLYIELRFALP